MSKAMELVGIILLGIFTLVIINLMNDVRSTNELDYYLLQETVEASMYDAVDYTYYRENGLIKVDRDMFIESFTRRFAESVDASNLREYKIKILDFNETPPKASVEVTTVTAASVKGQGVSVVNRVDGIIETIYDDYVYSRGFYQMLVNPIPATPVDQSYAAIPEQYVYEAEGYIDIYEATYAENSYSASCTTSGGGVWNKGGCGSKPSSGVVSCTDYKSGYGYDGCWECLMKGEPTRSCSCPNGGSLEGETCKTAGYTCPRGGNLSGTTCTNSTLRCPSGGDLNMSNKTCTTIRYTCPNGGVLDGQKCEKLIYTCPEGRVLKGTSCVVYYDNRK